MKKILVLFIMLLVLCSCSTKKEETAPTTIGGKQQAIFESSKSTDLNEIADELIKAQSDMSLVSMEVTPGYLNGFNGDVNSFEKGVQVSPMIGAIPYIIYVFETKDVDTLKKELDDKHDMRWNICTEADEYLLSSKDNLVFCIMCSNEE